MVKHARSLQAFIGGDMSLLLIFHMILLIFHISRGRHAILLSGWKEREQVCF